MSEVKKVLNNIFSWSNLITFACAMAILWLLSGPVAEFVSSLLIKFAEKNSPIFANLLLFIFVLCSLILLVIIYWLFWDNKRLKSKITNYVSQLICKDYYKEDKKIRYDKVAAANVGSGHRRLEVGDDFFEGKVKEDHGTSSEDGKQDEQGIYIDGKFTGIRRVYYANGNAKEEIPYKNNLIHGTAYNYYPDGRVHNEKSYLNGQLNGIYRAYDEDGSPFFEISYKDDKQHGLDRIFYRNGAVQYEDTYVDGLKVHRKTFDESGSLKFEQDFSP